MPGYSLPTTSNNMRKLGSFSGSILGSFVALLTLSIPCIEASGADSIPEYLMKSTYLYNFAVFSTWPESTAKTFNICIVGQDPFNNAMRTIENKEIRGLPINISRLNTLDNIKSCQILFFSESEILTAKKILTAVEDSPILTITDATNTNGFMIRLNTENNHLTFDVNYEAAQKHHLTISSKILRFARQVY